VAIALAYCRKELIAAVKCFIVQAQGANPMKLFAAVFYGCCKVLHAGRLRPYPQTLDEAGKAS
jgi:hypothetical protein